MSAHVNKVLRATIGLEPSDVTPARLLQIGEDALGGCRLAHAVDAIRSGPLCERHRLFGEVAALSVGTDLLGEAWWSAPLPGGLAGSPPSGPTPDDVLTGRVPVPGGRSVYGPLDYLGPWIAECAAVPTTLSADLNDPTLDDVVPLPPGASVGQRHPVRYDYGARVDAVIRADRRGRLHTRLDLDTAGYTTPAEAGWAVDLTLGRGRHLLPSEVRGDEPDPYAAPMPAAPADVELLEAALADAGRPHPLRTTGDAVDLLAALEPVELFTISRTIWAILANRPDARDRGLKTLRDGSAPRW